MPFGSRLAHSSNNKHEEMRVIRFMTHFQGEIADVELSEIPEASAVKVCESSPNRLNQYKEVETTLSTEKVIE